MKKKSIAFKTLGCRLNQYETEALASTFKKQDYEIVDFQHPADVYIINSCTVTNQSDRKVRNYISQARKGNNKSLTVVAGCISSHQKKLLMEKNQVDYLVDNDKKSAVFSIVEAHFKGETISLDEIEAGKFDYIMTEKLFHTRGFLKIQDGCDNFCTFCIIPFVRGRAISRSVSEVLTNARQHVQAGYKELVVTGVNIGRYRHGETTFEDLVEKILEIPGNFRVRISSLEPEGIGEKFIKLMAHPKMSPHLHLCLQSGSDRILLKMKRMYSYQQFKDIIHGLREAVPDVNITTDIMVGFPGETEDDFDATLRAMEEIAFGHVHAFKYSVRAGTRAERMEQHVPEGLKNERSRIIHELSEKHKLVYRKNFIGKKQKMLVEKSVKDNYSTGYGEHYIPIMLKTSKDVRDQFVDVEISGISPDDDHVLIGKLTSKKT
jgi:threonylcarbamoyladenosine tRNA methylthiotransferase MtaB